MWVWAHIMCVLTNMYSTLISHGKQYSRTVHLLFQKRLNLDIVDGPARQCLMEFLALEMPGVDGSSLRQHLSVLKGLCVRLEGQTVCTQEQKGARMGSMGLCFLEQRQESDAMSGDSQAAAVKTGLHL